MLNRKWAWLLAAALVVSSTGVRAGEIEDEVVDEESGTRAYVVSMTENEVIGFYKILKKMATKYEHTGKHANANKVDSRVKTKLKKESVTNVDDAYAEAWNCELTLTSTIILGGVRRKLINSAGESYVSQSDGTNGANYQAVQELSIDWDKNAKELVITVDHPTVSGIGTAALNKQELIGAFTTVGKSKFSKNNASASRTLSADYTPEGVEGEEGGEAQAEELKLGFNATGKKVQTNIVVDLIIDGSPYTFVRGALYLTRKKFGSTVSSVEIGFGVDWDPDALLDYESEFVRVATATCEWEETVKANLKFTDKLFHIDTFEEEKSKCYDDEVKRIVAHLDWHARGSEGIAGGERLPGVSSRIQFEVFGLNAAAGKKAKTRVRTAWHSKLDWRLEVQEIPSAFGVASRTSIEGVKNFLTKEFTLK